MEIQALYGRVIRSIESVEVRDEDVIRLTFEDGLVVSLRQSQDCCERRYFQVDDDLGYYAGAELRELKLARWGEIDDRVDYHEITFLDIHTTKGVLSICAHNEHNGYYGGFWVDVLIDGERVCYVPKEVSDDPHPRGER